MVCARGNQRLSVKPSTKLKIISNSTTSTLSYCPAAFLVIEKTTVISRNGLETVQCQKMDSCPEFHKVGPTPSYQILHFLNSSNIYCHSCCSQVPSWSVHVALSKCIWRAQASRFDQWFETRVSFFYGFSLSVFCFWVIQGHVQQPWAQWERT